MVNCNVCQSVISRTRPAVSCEVCKKQVHAVCIPSSNKSIDILAALNDVPGLSWKCNECRGNFIAVNQADINAVLENKVEEAISRINKQVISLKLDVIRAVKETTSLETPKYSDVLKNKTHPAVIIRPKNISQSVAQTKAEILQNVNPSQSLVQLAKVRNIKDGGLVVGCKTKDENERFKKLVEDKLSDKYEIKEVTGINPRVRIVGLSARYENEELRDHIMKCNSDLLLPGAECKIIKVFPTRKNDSIFQAVIQFDRISYEAIVKAGRCFIGYDSCSVFEAVEVYRCYKCNDFNHSSKSCQKSISCPLCGGDHEVKNCKSPIRKCSNCMRLAAADNTISVDHAVWEREKCSTYTKALNKLKSDLFLTQ